MTIQRYEIPDYDYGVRKVDREPREMDLVTYDDHLAALAEKDAALARERGVREKLVSALEAAKVRVGLSDDEINRLDGEVSMSHTWHTINAALLAAKELK